MSLRICKLGVVQLIAGPDVVDNLVEAERLIVQAAERGAEFVLLPEYFACISADETTKIRIRETLGNGPIQKFLSGMARKHSLWLVGGTIPLQANDDRHVCNTSLVFDPQGEVVARYDKIHLFGFQHGAESYDESRTIEAGSDIVCFEGPCGRVGLSVCYDLRFPELYRNMGGVDLIVVPAAFTATTGLAHWEVLLRARAIENQCYVLACGQGGAHPCGRKTWGHSMLVDPWGDVVASLGFGVDVLVAEFDPERILAVRESLPALKHRIF
jgi:deaminated glutathione amidase